MFHYLTVQGNVSSSDSDTNIKAALGASYMCKANLELKDTSNNVTLETSNLQVQAFQFGKTSVFDTGKMQGYTICNVKRNTDYSSL